MILVLNDTSKNLYYKKNRVIMPEDINKEKTVGDILSEVIEDKSKKMNDIFTKLFIYGPELFKIPIKDLEERINKEENEKTN